MKIQKYLKGNVLNPYIQEWGNLWRERIQPSASSKVLLKWNATGRKPKPETSQERTNRRIKEETKRTWRSDAADIAHGIGEGVLALNPYTAIPYYGAKVGQDVINGNVGWQTAVNASIPLFHLSPQAVGLKEATNVALEDAANAGSKTARNWRVAREINLTTKSKPKYTKVPSKNLFRTLVYKGGEITDPYSNFITTDPLYAANYGKVTPYIFESNSIAKAREPMIGSRDPVTMDMFIYNNTKSNPEANAIIGHDKVTGEFAPSNGIEVYSMSPRNLFKINQKESPTSLKFFERKPTKQLSTSDMKPFIDDYGREIIPTPWKGSDLELIDLILENQVNILRDYFSPLKKEQVMKAMNWGEKEYSELLDELMRSIGTLTKGEVKGPKDGFTIIAQHKGQAVGEGENMTGLHTMTFNRERIPDKKTAVEAITHEIGGHGKTMSINPNKPNKISEAFPRMTLLMLKNQELANNILKFNGRGKFFSQFPKVSDLELYVYNNNVPKHKLENLFNLRRYFLYVTNDILERAARAYIGQLMDKLGFDKTLNIKQLERYYTPKSVDEFKKAVLNYGLPATVGGSTLYKISSLKQGGKMNNVIQKFKEQYKKGGSIYIKPSKRGSFTKYCNGKVTNECIARGKRSPSAAIRKKATFAQNARRWSK